MRLSFWKLASFSKHLGEGSTGTTESSWLDSWPTGRRFMNLMTRIRLSQYDSWPERRSLDCSRWEPWSAPNRISRRSLSVHHPKIGGTFCFLWRIKGRAAHAGRSRRPRRSRHDWEWKIQSTTCRCRPKHWLIAVGGEITAASRNSKSFHRCKSNFNVKFAFCSGGWPKNALGELIIDESLVCGSITEFNELRRLHHQEQHIERGKLRLREPPKHLQESRENWEANHECFWVWAWRGWRATEEHRCEWRWGLRKLEENRFKVSFSLLRTRHRWRLHYEELYELRQRHLWRPQLCETSSIMHGFPCDGRRRYETKSYRSSIHKNLPFQATERIQFWEKTSGSCCKFWVSLLPELFFKNLFSLETLGARTGARLDSSEWLVILETTATLPATQHTENKNREESAKLDWKDKSRDRLIKMRKHSQ